MTIMAPIEIDRYSSPAALALASGSPELVCRMIFAACFGDRDRIIALRGPSHLPDLCRLRYAVTYAARSHAGATFSQIGRALNRDGNGSVVTRSFNRAKTLLHDRSFQNECERLREVVEPREAMRLAARVSG